MGQDEAWGESICSLLREPSYFGEKNEANNTQNNKFFCVLEPTSNRRDAFAAHLPYWEHYHAGGGVVGQWQLLNMMYTTWKCNQMVHEYQTLSGTEYAYKIRLRTDTAFLAPIPSVLDLDFGPPTAPVQDITMPNVDVTAFPPCESTIRISSRKAYPGGLEDSFGIGRAADMDYRLSDYVQFTQGNYSENKWLMLGGEPWNHEGFLSGYLRLRRICLQQDDRIRMVIVRLKNHVAHAANAEKPPHASIEENGKMMR